jgi:hypothetical protein
MIYSLECEAVIPGCANCVFVSTLHNGNSKFNTVKCTQCISGLYLDSYQNTYSDVYGDVIYYHTVCLPECIRGNDVFEKDYVFGECLNSSPLYTKLQSGCDSSCRECTGSGLPY